MAPLLLAPRRSPLMQLCAVVALLLACCSLHAAQAAVTVTAKLDMTNQVTLGNVFVTAAAEQVTLRVGTTVTVSGAGALPFYNNTGVGLAWNVTDFFGVVRASGAVERLPSGSVTSELKPFGTTTRPPAGFFVLNLRLLDRNSSDALLQSNFTTFAVLWPVAKPLGVRYGVGEHYGQGYSTLTTQLLAKAGLGAVRDSNGWATNEPTTKGTYVWTASDPWMLKLNQSGLDPLYILAYGNDLYDYWTGGCDGNDAGETVPYTQTGLDGFAEYAKALVQHFGQNLTSIEVWNEIYTSFYCGPPDVMSNFSLWYTNVVKAVYPAVKSVRPDVKVLGGAVAAVAPMWFESLFKLGAIDYMDVLSVHPYSALPENVEVSLPQLQAYAKQYSPSVAKEIWATEYGWSTDNDKARYSVAKYLVRQTLTQGLNGVTRHYWYDMVDDNYEKFGLVKNTAYRGPMVPNPAFVAYANLARLLGTATFQKRVNTELGRRAYVLLFNSPQYGEVRAVWTTLPYDNVLYLRTTKAVTLVDIQGGNVTLAPSSGVVTVKLSDTPQFVVGGAITDSWGESRYVGMADNAYDYTESTTLGTNNWWYGRFVTPQLGAPASAYNQSHWSRLWPQRNLWGSYWLQYASIAATTVTPSVDNTTGTPQINWAVLRYTANATIANASLSGYLVLSSADAGADGVYARVYVDGKIKWEKTLVPADHLFFPTTFLVEDIDLVPGLNVDFVVTPGPGANKASDGVTAYITVGVPRDPGATPSWVVASENGDKSAAATLRGRSPLHVLYDYATA